MIHLDTNVLIALPLWARSSNLLIDRIVAGESVAVSTLAWYEYRNGPLAADHLALVRSLIGDHLVPFDEAIAELAAKLFNAVGRRRSLKFDACIAACAIIANVELATQDTADFAPFLSQGLRLAKL